MAKLTALNLQERGWWTFYVATLLRWMSATPETSKGHSQLMLTGAAAESNWCSAQMHRHRPIACPCVHAPASRAVVSSPYGDVGPQMSPDPALVC